MQQNAPLVAVVTPVYNGARFLREALESVQAQTYPNLVHFVLDNASTDATPALIDEYRGRRVPVVSERNVSLLPQCENWNRCVELGAQGSAYFRVLCADETLPAVSTEKIVHLAENDPAIMLVGSECLHSVGPSNYGWPKDRQVFEGLEALRSCLTGDTGLAPTHLLYRTSVLGRRAQFFESKVASFDVEVAFFLLSLPGARFGFIDEFLGFVRQHDNTVSATFTDRLHTEYFDWLYFMEKFGHAALPGELRTETARRFRRHYWGRLLVWRFRQKNIEAFEWHKTALASIGQVPRFADFADAIVDYALRKTGLRRSWSCYPQG